MAGRAEPLTRQEAILKFRALCQAAGRPLRYSEIPRSLRLRLLAQFRTLDAARRAANVPAPPLSRRWSTEVVLRELHKVSRRGVVASARGLIDAGHRDLMEAVYHYVGSLVRARVLARVPHPRYRQREKEPWDEDRVVGEILDLHEKGKPVAYSKVEPRLLDAAKRYFGSWRSAIEAAGLDYAKIRLKREDFTEDELLDLLRGLSRKRPAMPLAEVHGLSVANVLRRMFGSIESAARRAGLTDWPKRSAFRALPRRQVIARLRARRAVGRPIYSTSVVKEDARLWRSAISHYGDWPHVLAAARLKSDSPKKRTWSRQLVIERLRERQRRGLSLRPTDVQADDGSLYTAAVNLFGPYRTVAKRLGVETSKHHWKKTQVIRELRRAARGRRWLTVERAPCALACAARKLFGTFSAACGAAGLEVHTKRKWTRDDVILGLRRLAKDGPVQRRRARVAGGLDQACVRFFGTFARAREVALSTSDDDSTSSG